MRDLSELLDVHQVARLLRMKNAQGVRKAISRGQLIPDRHGARRIALFWPETIDAYMRRRIDGGRPTPPSPPPASTRPVTSAVVPRGQHRFDRILAAVKAEEKARREQR